MSTPPALLEGVVIVELSSFVAAPLAGLVLAQLGADVIRVDPLQGGPDAHRWPLTATGTSLYWAGLNKGKRSARLDLREESGRAAVRGLLALGGDKGGILITNAVGQEWLEVGALSADRADLIHVKVMGQRNGAPAVDYTVNAASGFPLVTGPVDLARPVNHVLPAWDVSCGLYAALGLLAALRRRDTTGQGASVEVALEDVAVSTAGHLGFLAEAQVNHSVRPRIGNHLYGGFAGDFTTSDTVSFMVVALTQRQWDSLLGVTGTADAVRALEEALAVDFTDEGARYQHREVLTALVRSWFARTAAVEVEAALGRTSVLWSRFRSFSDVVSAYVRGDATSDVLVDIDQPGVGRHLAPASPLVVDGRRTNVRPAPEPGSDTEAVLQRATAATRAEHER
jgi:2-methylfumaryl-CoA isomerase